MSWKRHHLAVMWNLDFTGPSKGTLCYASPEASCCQQGNTLIQVQRDSSCTLQCNCGVLLMLCLLNQKWYRDRPWLDKSVLLVWCVNSIMILTIYWKRYVEVVKERNSCLSDCVCASFYLLETVTFLTCILLLI